MVKWVKKMLDQIAKANEETFKGQKIDCCEMNRNNQGGSKHKQKNCRKHQKAGFTAVEVKNLFSDIVKAIIIYNGK